MGEVVATMPEMLAELSAEAGGAGNPVVGPAAESAAEPDAGPAVGSAMGAGDANSQVRCMPDSLLPIGSAVRLEGASSLALVIGFYADDGERMYDYLAVPYPEGLGVSGEAVFFDADAVAEVVAPGYQDDQGAEVLAAAVEMMNARERAYIAIGQEMARQGLIDGNDGPDASAGTFNME